MSAGTIDKAPENLQRLVGELEAEGVHHFNPVRFRYIRAMADRSLEQAGAVVPVVVEKALLAIAQYQRDLSRERAVAEATVEQLAQTHPEAGPTAQAMLASCDFDGIRQLAGRLQRPATENGLSQLVEQLGLGGTSTAGTPECAHLETILRRQEAAVLQSRADAEQDNPPLLPRTQGELRAARYFRDSQARRHAETLIARATREAPQDSGPLNPQKLAIRSLAAMQELSPAYLSRFVAYVDTLLWLDSVDETTKS